MSIFDHEAEGWDEWDDADWDDNRDYLAWLNEQERGTSLGEASKCTACEYLFAVVGNLCQYCEAKVAEDIPDVFAGFEKLLTNHLAFAKWEEANRAQPAQAA